MSLHPDEVWRLWPECFRVYGTESGCDLPPAMRSDGEAWPSCIRCAVLFTANFAGLCVGCRRWLSLPQARPVDLQTGPQKSPRGDHHE
jgi:hypothetical protein